MNAYRQHTTKDLLHKARVTRPLALVQELESRGYHYNTRLCRFVKESLNDAVIALEDIASFPLSGFYARDTAEQALRYIAADREGVK